MNKNKTAGKRGAGMQENMWIDIIGVFGQQDQWRP